MKTFLRNTLILFLILALVIPLMGAASAVKMVRLEVINVSGDVVYLKLQATVGDAFYYLTIPDGKTQVFTLETDLYKRTTWACGYTNSGKLNLTSNTRLKFIECDRMPTKMVSDPKNMAGCVYIPELSKWKCPNYGEPTMEKVQYFKYRYGLMDGCAGWVLSGTFKSPAPWLCAFRYRY